MNLSNTSLISSFPRRSAFAFMASLAAGLGATSCGSVENPKDVTVLKLKPPMNLQVLPGQGQVTLTWTANNNEDDFSGYNIYLSQDDPSQIFSGLKLSPSASSDLFSMGPIVLRDEKESEIEGVRTSLAKHFNFDAAAGVNKDAGDGKTITPMARCNVAKTFSGEECIALTESNEENKANGLVSYTVKNLKPGTLYTFVVTATLDGGKKIVSPTSNVISVRPRDVQTLPAGMAFKSAAEATTGFDGLDFESGSPERLSFSTANESLYCLPAPGSHSRASQVDVYFQSVGASLRQPTLTGANGARVTDLGPVKDNANKLVMQNLLESPFRLNGTAMVPAVVGAKPAPTAIPQASDMGVKAGYSRCGQSVLLLPYHLYGIAFVSKGQWRYALMETGSEESLRSPSSFRIVVGAPGERRM